MEKWKIVLVLVVCGLVGFGLGLALPVQAQTPAAETAKASPAAPSLTEVQKLQLQVGLQKLELLQAKVAVLQGEFETVRQGLLKQVDSLKIEGYELNLQTLTYEPKPVPKAPTAGPDPAIKK